MLEWFFLLECLFCISFFQAWDFSSWYNLSKLKRKCFAPIFWFSHTGFTACLERGDLFCFVSGSSLYYNISSGKLHCNETLCDGLRLIQCSRGYDIVKEFIFIYHFVFKVISHLWVFIFFLIVASVFTLQLVAVRSSFDVNANANINFEKKCYIWYLIL